MQFTPSSFWRSAIVTGIAVLLLAGGPLRGADFIRGDANGDGQVNVGDAVYTIAYVFSGGPPPQPYNPCSGDANCDGVFDAMDITQIVNVIFGALSVCGGEDLNVDGVVDAGDLAAADRIPGPLRDGRGQHDGWDGRPHVDDATPPPGTIPSSTAARVALKASSTRCFFSFSSTSVAAPTPMTATPPANLAKRSWSFSRS